MTDEDEIRVLVRDHFDGMKWDDQQSPDWDRFRKDFFPGAILCGAARPAQLRSLDEFIERMETVARKNLKSFEEQTRSMKILKFGSIAVVLAMSELLEDGTDINRDVSGYLLVKSEGAWKIIAHTWDQESEDKPIPEVLRLQSAG